MAHPTLTVIIPTRERADVLGKSLATATLQNLDGLQILVSDNFSGDRTEEVVRDTNDSRVTYINPRRRLSMAHHWEFALSHVQQGWVTVIGDDDGLLPGAASRALDLAKAMEVDALRTRVCQYSWPSLTGTSSGSLRVPLGSGEEVRDSAVWLSRALRGRAQYAELPMLYNGGFVKASVLDRLRANGPVYRSCNPDVYSAAAIASVLPRYGYSNVPLAINGASKHSTGTSFFRADGSTGPARMFLSEGNIPFHEDVPLTARGVFPLSLQIAFYESYLQSAPLRPGAPDVHHAEQLDIVLAQAAAGDADLRAWAALFASKHGLDLSRATSRATRRRLTTRLRSMPTLVAATFGELRLGSPALPLRDVHEAVLAAGNVLRHSPPRFTAAYQGLGHVWNKLVGKLSPTV